jgi:hypothetical protein
MFWVQFRAYSSASLAALDGHRRIYMLGFDMGPNPENKINNIYAGTEFYKRIDAPPTFTGNWIKQITENRRKSSKHQFIRVAGATTAKITELEGLPNLCTP